MITPLTLARQGCCHSTARAASPPPPQPNLIPYRSPSAPTSTHEPPASPSPPTSAAAALPSPRPHRRRRPSPTERRPNRPLRPHARAVAAPARWTRARLARERAAFFETRVTGRPEVWAALRAAAECLRAGDGATAQGVLDAAGVTVPSGDLVDGAYDEAGVLYALVAWVVADPEDLEDEEEEEGEGDEGTERGDEGVEGMGGKGLGLGKVSVVEESEEERKRTDEKGKGKSVKKGEGVKVRARLSDRAQDVVVWVGKDESVRSVVNRVREEAMVILRPLTCFVCHAADHNPDRCPRAHRLHGSRTEGERNAFGAGLERGTRCQRPGVPIIAMMTNFSAGPYPVITTNEHRGFKTLMNWMANGPDWESHVIHGRIRLQSSCLCLAS